MSAPRPHPSRLSLAEISAILRAEPRVAQWQVTELQSVRSERYLTFLATESEREVSTTAWQVWLALPAIQERQGEASFTLEAGDDSAAARERLAVAIDCAGSAPNPAFGLPRPGESGCASQPGDPDALADGAILDAPGRAIDRLCQEYASAAQAATWVRPSTLEVFLTSSSRRLVNHLGLELHDRRTKAFIEYVLLHRPSRGDEVEFYDSIQTTSLADLALAKRVGIAASSARDGALAIAAPSGRMPVVIGEEYLAALMSYYAYHCDAGIHARKINAFAMGSLLMDRVSGDPFSLDSDPKVGSEGSYLFDDQGFAPCVQRLVERDRVVGMCGSARWMRALGREPRGTAGTLVVAAGSTPARELMAGALEIVRFSDFHPRNDTGAFSGEIRLAYLHRADGTRVPVKGGSVTGTLAEAMSSARFSSELITTGRFHGPRAVRFEQLTVAG